MLFREDFVIFFVGDEENLTLAMSWRILLALQIYVFTQKRDRVIIEVRIEQEH
jgi:hypothetical protein